MKALSVRQPWAWAILHAGKDVENRDWRDDGGNLKQARRLAAKGETILLHTGAGMTRAEYEHGLDTICAIRPDLAVAVAKLSRETIPRGGIVGSFRIVRVTSDALTASRWFAGRWGLVLADVVPLGFVPLAGQLGFFDVPDAVVRALRPLGAAA